jgi:hypothetical protein
LIRADVIPSLRYNDATNRHEYVVFSDSARKAKVPQYFDNRQVYGYITMSEEPEVAATLLAPELASLRASAKPSTRLNVMAGLGLRGGWSWAVNLMREIKRGGTSRSGPFVPSRRTPRPDPRASSQPAKGEG